MRRFHDGGVSGTPVVIPPAFNRIFDQPPAYKPPVFDVTLLPPATGGQVLVLRGLDPQWGDDDDTHLPSEIIRYYSALWS